MRKNRLLVIGAGPAGLTAAQYGARAGLDVTVLEELEAGGQALHIDILENYPGWDGAKSGREFAAVLRRQAAGFGVRFITARAGTLTIQQAGDGPAEGGADSGGGRPGSGSGHPGGRAGGRFFSVALDDGGEVSAEAVILALGAAPRKLGIAGEDALAGAGVSYCATCDGPFFKNKKIFVAGGGDAACDNARILARITPNVTLVHRRGELRAQKAVGERVLRDERVTVRLHCAIAEIRGEGRVRSVTLEDTVTGKRTEEAADAVFIYAGLVPRNGITQNLEPSEKPELDAGGFIVTGQDMATRAAGLFCAGDLRASPFRQVVVAAAEGAIAAHAAAAYINNLDY